MMAKVHRLHHVTHFDEGICAGARPAAGGGLVTEAGTMRGTWESVPFAPGCEVKVAVASWSADARPGTWVEVGIRAEIGGRWGRWFSFGRWSAGADRGSINDQTDETGRMDTDTFRPSQPPDRLQLRVTLEGTVTLHKLRMLLAGEGAQPDPQAYERATNTPYIAAWGKDLPVPTKSQMIYPDGGRVWCSPVSLAMVLGYWGVARSIPDELVPLVYDPVYKGHGNWPFNTAVASLFGLDAYVTRLYGLPQLERWIEAGIPVVASVAYQRAWLENAPIDQTGGHLLVVRGFTPAGDVIVNDPAGSSDQEVLRVYKRDQFDRAWTGHSGGVVYLIHPREQHIPGDSLGAW